MIIIILSFYPFFRIGFTNADDFDFYLRGIQGGLFEDAYWYARGQGRFYFLFMKPLYHVPYLIDNFYFTKIIQHGMTLLSFTLFAIVVRKIFCQKEISILVFLLLLSFLSVSLPLYFFPIIAFPFYFSLSFSIFMLSLIFLIKYIETKKYYYNLLSAIVFALAMLFYETYLFILFYICLFIFFHNITNRGKSMFRNKLFYKEILPFIFVGLIYLAAYFLYRQTLPEKVANIYVGTTFAAHFNISNFFKILWNYNLATIPTCIYHCAQRVIDANSLSLTGHQPNIWYIITHTNLASLVNTLLQCFVFFLICHKMNNKISWKKIGLAAITLLLLSFSVHILLGLSEKHNASAEWTSQKSYITTFFSYFFITLLIGIAIYAGIKACSKVKWLKRGFIIVLTSIFFIASIIIGYSNDHLSRDYEHCQNNFTMVDKVLKKGIFNDISEDAIIYSKDLSSSSSAMVNATYLHASPSVWRNYIFAKTRKIWDINNSIEYIQEKISDSFQHDLYYIAYYDSYKTRDMMLVLSKINNESIHPDEGENMFYNATADEAKVYYYSNEKQFTLSFFIPECGEGASFFINDVEQKAMQGTNVITLNNTNKREEVTFFTLKSEHPFSVKRFMISHFVFPDTQIVNIP
jgi:hypothetical protein